MKPFKKIETTQLFWFSFFCLLLSGFFWVSCESEESTDLQEYDFTLSSISIEADSLLPKEYTCDGSSATLPLEWSGAPEETVSFALIMDHEVSATDIHWYWVLYDIPPSVSNLPKNISNIGSLGTNSVNNQMAYAPPCSQGLGLKKYRYTVYALSENPVFTVSTNKIDREALLNAIEDITLSSASMSVYYSRE